MSKPEQNMLGTNPFSILHHSVKNSSAICQDIHFQFQNKLSSSCLSKQSTKTPFKRHAVFPIKTRLSARADAPPEKRKTSR
jgi:hypothetical protein